MNKKYIYYGIGIIAFITILVISYFIPMFSFRRDKLNLNEAVKTAKEYGYYGIITIGDENGRHIKKDLYRTKFNEGQKSIDEDKITIVTGGEGLTEENGGFFEYITAHAKYNLFADLRNVAENNAKMKIETNFGTFIYEARFKEVLKVDEKGKSGAVILDNDGKPIQSKIIKEGLSGLLYTCYPKETSKERYTILYKLIERK